MANPHPFATVNHIPLALGILYVSLVQGDLVLEAVSMIYRYLEAEGIQIIGPKSIGAIEGGFIFDVFPTARGPIWFKDPMSAT